MMVAFGSKGEISGAKSATKTQKITITAPIIPTQLSRSSTRDFTARTAAVPRVGAGRVLASRLLATGEGLS